MKADLQSVYAVCAAASQQIGAATKSATSAENATAFFTAVSALAIVATALYAKKAYEQARYNEKVRLTVAMMEAPWLLQAWNSFVSLLNAIPLTELRTLVVLAEQLPVLSAEELAGQLPEGFRHQDCAQAVLQFKNTIGTLSGSLTYVSTLYAAGYYDNEVLLSRGYSTTLMAYFVLEPQLQNGVKAGHYDSNIFALGRAVAELARRDGRLFPRFPVLKDYMPGEGIPPPPPQHPPGELSPQEHAQQPE